MKLSVQVDIDVDRYIYIVYICYICNIYIYIYMCIYICNWKRLIFNQKVYG